MTATALTAVRMPRAPRPGWRAVARVLWLESRATIVALGTLLVAFALAVVLTEHAVASAFHTYVSAGCLRQPFKPECVTTSSLSQQTVVSALRIAAGSFPVVAGMFLGAPLLAREYESGTFRFTWTQAIGRRRLVLCSLVLIAVAAMLVGIVLGVLIDWVDHPFQVVGVTSQWQAGTFDDAPVLLGAWSAFGCVVGVGLGALVRRVVAAIAAVTAVLGALMIGATIALVHWLLAIGPLVRSHLVPITNAGTLNEPSPRGQLFPGAWFVRAWYVGPHGHVLTSNEVLTLEEHMFSKGTSQRETLRYLAAHHITYFLAYQPQSRFWLFQLASIAILLVASAALAWGILWLVRRSAG